MNPAPIENTMAWAQGIQGGTNINGFVNRHLQQKQNPNQQHEQNLQIGLYETISLPYVDCIPVTVAQPNIGVKRMNIPVPGNIWHSFI